MSSASSVALADGSLVSNEPVCASLPFAKPAPKVEVSFAATSATPRSMPTSKASAASLELSMSSAAGSRASRTRARRAGASVEQRMTVGSGQKCYASFPRSGPLGFVLKTLLTSRVWHSDRWLLVWKVSATKQRRLKFRLVPLDMITFASASGFSATPTATANQACPSMTKWSGCRGAVVSPESWEKRMGFPPGWINSPCSETPSSLTSPNRSDEPS